MAAPRRKQPDAVRQTHDAKLRRRSLHYAMRMFGHTHVSLLQYISTVYDRLCVYKY